MYTKQHYGIIILLILFSQINYAQTKNGTGLLFNESDYEAIKTIPYDYGQGKSADLPLSVDLKPWTPKIANQGMTSSCVGWAVGYGCLTMMHAKINGWTDKERITKEAFSAYFLYNNIKLGEFCEEGAYLTKAGEFLTNMGDCKSRIFDTKTTNCDNKGTHAIKEIAQKFKIKKYYKVFGAKEEPQNKRYNIKRNLAEGFPVVVGMKLRANFYNLKTDFWYPYLQDTMPDGNHALVVVGYDNNKNAFEVMNSWGDKWGNKGYCWIQYDDFAAHAMGAIRLIVDKDYKDDTNPDVLATKIDYEGHFEFRQFKYHGVDKPGFYNAQVKKTGDFTYTTSKKDWKVDDGYRFFVKKTQVNRMIYVFSFDAKGSNIHWPRPKKATTNGTLQSGEAPVIPFDSVQIIIPGKNRMLTKRIKGDDNIIILYSYTEIDDFEERVKRVKNTFGSAEMKLSSGFGDLIIPPKDVQYSDKEMSFISKTNASQTIIPMILTLKGE